MRILNCANAIVTAIATRMILILTIYDEMRWDEMRWDEMRWDEMRWRRNWKYLICKLPW